MLPDRLREKSTQVDRLLHRGERLDEPPLGAQHHAKVIEAAREVGTKCRRMSSHESSAQVDGLSGDPGRLLPTAEVREDGSQVTEAGGQLGLISLGASCGKLAPVSHGFADER